MVCGMSCLSFTTNAEEEHSNKPTYISLGEFTVNLPGGEALTYLVVAVTIEVAPEAATDLRDIMPRLKETIIRRLMAMADRGALQPGHTDPLMLKTSLLETVGKLRPNGVRDVLITRLLYG
jgi:flagellar basal body-associated protein FliL